MRARRCSATASPIAVGDGKTLSGVLGMGALVSTRYVTAGIFASQVSAPMSTRKVASAGTFGSLTTAG